MFCLIFVLSLVYSKFKLYEVRFIREFIGLDLFESLTIKY